MSGFLLHPAGLEVRLAFLALEPRDLIAKLLDGLGLLLAALGLMGFAVLGSVHHLLPEAAATGRSEIGK
ncbi:MAG: hypothetical protein VBE63_23775 [Lamprobacter sp.]|uniref:hypothetical protein n=1 Tax=Lamprobacter sp. TaxID=3100796 RepID=UPI002B25AF5F|nr:hypothetical protein [Lamprobacter sp.]MEA3642935.1 hypothetical protein [Lamprobacter sp.]